MIVKNIYFIFLLILCISCVSNAKKDRISFSINVSKENTVLGFINIYGKSFKVKSIRTNGEHKKKIEDLKVYLEYINEQGAIKIPTGGKEFSKDGYWTTWSGEKIIKIEDSNFIDVLESEISNIGFEILDN